MRRLFLLAAITTAGCADKSPPSVPKPDDPNIRAKETIDGRAGPVGGGRSREYEGPAYRAPEWAKPKAGGGK